MCNISYTKQNLVHSVAKNMRLASEILKMENLCLVDEAFKKGLGKFIHSQKYEATSFHVKLP